MHPLASPLIAAALLALASGPATLGAQAPAGWSAPVAPPPRGGATTADVADAPTGVLLARHAERGTVPADDPPPGEAGGAPARALAAPVGGAGPRHGEVRVASFDAPSLGVRKHYVVYLPPSYAAGGRRRYPVAYYLHGADGNEADWVSRAALDLVMDSLVARGAPEMIVVMPDGDESWYANSATPASYDECTRGHYGEDPTLHCVRRAEYETYIARDLVRHVDSTYRTRADRAHRAIAGLSMGGLGALHAALAHPETFSAAVSHSGVVSLLLVGPRPYSEPAAYAATALDTLRAGFGDRYWGEMRAAFGGDVAAWRAADPTELARRLREAGRPVPALYFDAGRDDALTIDRNRAFDAELTTLGVPHRYAEWPGRHEWRYWRAHLGEGLAWLGERIGK